MNEKIISAIKATNKSIYQISKETAIPYTVLSEIMTGKKSINHIMAETVLKLSIYLKKDVGELLNDVDAIDGVSGTYKKVKYKWLRSEEGICLHLQYKGNDFEAASWENIFVKDIYLFAICCAKIYIDEFLKQIELKELYGKLRINA